MGGTAPTPVPSQFQSQAKHSRGVPFPPFMKGMPKGCIHVAAVGTSGTGKTAFVNALRNLGQHEIGASLPNHTGVDGTLQPTPHWYPGAPPAFLPFDDQELLQGGRWVTAKVPVRRGQTESRSVLLLGSMSPQVWTAMLEMPYNNVTISERDIERVSLECVIWDLPGVGTEKFPKEQYVEQMGLRCFDVVIFVHGPKFLQHDVHVMQALRAFNVPCFHVRAKIDEVVESARREETGKEAKDEAERQVLAKIREVMRREAKVDKAYVVCSLKPDVEDPRDTKHWNSWDFPELRTDIHEKIASCRAVAA